MTKTVRILVIIGIAVLAFWLWWQFRISNRLLDELTEQKSTNAELVKSWKDKDSIQHDLFRANSYSLDYIKASHDSDMQALRKDYGNKLNNLQSRLSLQIQTQGQVSTGLRDTSVTINNNIFHFKSFNYSDKWLSLQGIVQADSVTIRYSIDNDVKVDYKWEKPSLFKSKELRIDIMTGNPNSTVQNVKSIVVHKDTKWYETKLFSFALGVAAGTYLNRK